MAVTVTDNPENKRTFACAYSSRRDPRDGWGTSPLEWKRVAGGT